MRTSIKGTLDAYKDTVGEFKKTDEMVNIYSEIEGIGTFTLADSTVDTIIAVGVEIAIQVAVVYATMGIGSTIANSISLGSKAGTAGTRLATKIGFGAKIAGIISKIGVIGVEAGFEGTFFHFGTKLFDNLRNEEKLEDAFKGFGDKKEILKSIAFMGILKGIGAIHEMKALAAESIKAGEQISESVWKGIISKGLSIPLETATLTGTGMVVDVAFGEGFKRPTWEQLLHTMAMVIGFRMLAKSTQKISGPKTKIEVSQNTAGELVITEKIKQIEDNAGEVESKQKSENISKTELESQKQKLEKDYQELQLELQQASAQGNKNAEKNIRKEIRELSREIYKIDNEIQEGLSGKRKPQNQPKNKEETESRTTDEKVNKEESKVNTEKTVSEEMKKILEEFKSLESIKDPNQKIELINKIIKDCNKEITECETNIERRKSIQKTFTEAGGHAFNLKITKQFHNNSKVTIEYNPDTNTITEKSYFNGKMNKIENFEPLDILQNKLKEIQDIKLKTEKLKDELLILENIKIEHKIRKKLPNLA